MITLIAAPTLYDCSFALDLPPWMSFWLDSSSDMDMRCFLAASPINRRKHCCAWIVPKVLQSGSTTVWVGRNKVSLSVEMQTMVGDFSRRLCSLHGLDVADPGRLRGHVLFYAAYCTNRKPAERDARDGRSMLLLSKGSVESRMSE